MSKPLTRQQENDLVDYGGDAACIALARLRFLERKLQAAEQLARRLATSNCLLVGISKTHDAQIAFNRKAIEDYNAVTDDDTVPGMEP